MGCVQSGVEGFFVPDADDTDTPGLLTTVVPESSLPTSARVLLRRLNVLSACFLIISTYFVAVMCATGKYDHVGAAGLSLLQAVIVRHVSIKHNERTLQKLTHLHACFVLFLILSVAKGMALMVVLVAKCDGDSLFCEGALPVCNLFVLASLGYLTYVSTLCLQRLALWYLGIGLGAERHVSIEKERESEVLKT
jgi:hypothetical protein